VSRYNSSHDMAAKMDSEGGLSEFIFGYGLNPEDIPDDMPEVMRDKLHALRNLSHAYDSLQSWLYERMDDDPKPGDYDYEEPATL
jgi:hypothetical protein